MGEFAAQTPPRGSSFFREYRVPFIFLLASAVLVLAASIVFVTTLRVSEPVTFSSDKARQSASESAELVVDIRGAVVYPGVYSVPLGGRIADVIDLAGGISADIDQDASDKMINRASFVTDGMKIYIPKKNTDVFDQSSQGSAGETIISINMGTKEALDGLPGIGEVTAVKIIENRPYGSIEELVSKHVLSASLLDKLRNRLSL